MKFKALLLITAFLNVCVLNAAPNYTEIENKAKIPFLSPDLAEQKTLKLKLANGMEVFIISDPKADQSAAAMVVQAGSWDDPDAYPGLAHFLEHMLFLGTKKYPETAAFDSFINEHGGSTNAYTASKMTSFIFSVDNAYFSQAIDRFADFFTAPLFNPSGVNRELHIIDQEYAKNLDNDAMRSYMVTKELSNPKHPNHRFSIGNTSTLQPVTQEILKNWYKEHYSANLMHLIVYSSQSLDELRELVVKEFSNVPTTNKALTYSDAPIADGLTGKMVYIQPVKDEWELSLQWEVPEKFIQMKDSQPETMICTWLGHEGENSLLAELKRESLADKLSCGLEKISNKNWQMVIIVTLTEQGVTHVNDVIERVFQTLALLKEKDIPPALFDEVKRMSLTNYQYKPREEAFNFMMKQTAMITEEDLSTFPEQTYIVQKSDPAAVKEFLNSLTPQNAQYILLAPSALTKVNLDKKERWMGVNYAVVPIEKSQLEQWAALQPNPKIKLPTANPFIPSKLTLVNNGTSSSDLVPHPELLINTDRARIYFAQDTRYHTPKVYLSFELKSPQIDAGNPLKVVLTDMYVKSVTEALSKFSYPATLGGLEYEIKRKEFGIQFTISGYSEHADRLLGEIVNQLKKVTITEEQFATYKQTLSREYLNTAKKSSLEQASELLKRSLYKAFTVDREKAHAIRNLTLKQYNDYTMNLLKMTYLEGVLYGNLTEQQAHQLADKTVASFTGEAYPEGRFKTPMVIVLPKNEGPFYFEERTQAQGNAVILAIENPDSSFKSYAAQQILMQAIKSPFFASLRTKQQTGYIIFSDIKEIERELFSLFLVQSNTHASRDLLARFEQFIEEFVREIKVNVTEEQFNQIRMALINELEKSEKSIEEMGVLLTKLAFLYDADFNWIDQRIAGLKELTYDEFLQSSEKVLGDDNRQRLGILVNGIHGGDVLTYSRLSNLKHLRRISGYSNGTLKEAPER